jgi:hypothetical protein
MPDPLPSDPPAPPSPPPPAPPEKPPPTPPIIEPPKDPPGGDNPGDVPAELPPRKPQLNKVKPEDEDRRIHEHERRPPGTYPRRRHLPRASRYAEPRAKRRRFAATAARGCALCALIVEDDQADRGG